MPYCDLPLYIDIGKKGALIVDLEPEYSMLIGQRERSTEDCAVPCLRCRYQVEAMEGWKHGDLKLKGVCATDLYWVEMIKGVLGDLNFKSLRP